MKAINGHKLKIVLTLIFVFLLFTLVSGCDDGANSPRGFSLPVGDAAKGEIAFKAFKCLACHNLEGSSAEPSQVLATEDGDLIDLEIPVTLGGDVERAKTYADLVTSIINPSHRISKDYINEQQYPKTKYDENGVSKMKVYNDVMTVTQLIDIVTFLEPHYHLLPYRSTDYGMYP